MTVHCRKCGKALELKPTSHNPLMMQILFWMYALEELCNECREGE